MYLMMSVSDFFTVGFLILMEGLLSLDNAVVLAVLVKDLPDAQRKRALTYGIWGAFIFRFLALFTIRALLGATWVRLLGGGYLAWVWYKWWRNQGEENQEAPGPATPFRFWRIVFMVEMMDIAFSMDSILASVAVSDKLWVILLGGCLGIIMMRIAASFFVSLLRRWPGLEKAAYWLILVLGIKLVVQWAVG